MTHTEKQGFVVFFTGLSGSGKTTLSKKLVETLKDQNRKVTLLDGDEVRQHLSSELGFSSEHRKINILRLGFIASEIAKHAGITICAAISPYQETREKVREMVEKNGRFIEVYLSTPLSVCEKRDVKGLYKKARKTEIKQFTGIDAPYEPPINPDLILDTTQLSIEHCIDKILMVLIKNHCAII